jgi:hypothetical protein
MRKPFLKILLLCLIFILSFSLFYFLYNKGRGDEIFAQEYETKCAVEIPIGNAIDETEKLAQEIISTAEFIIQQSTEAANSGEELVKLPDQCKAENCQSGCREWCEGQTNCGETTTPCVPYCHGNPPVCWNDICGQRQCGTDKDGNPIYCSVYCLYCSNYIPKCEIFSCSGNPCPSEQIKKKVQDIKDNYEKIKIAYEGGELNGEKIDGIKQLIEKPEEIFPLLGESRNKLKACSSPAEDYQKLLLEGSTLIKLVLSCENAKSMDPTLGDCSPNNYFCCE